MRLYWGLTVSSAFLTKNDYFNWILNYMKMCVYNFKKTELITIKCLSRYVQNFVVIGHKICDNIYKFILIEFKIWA